jgi:hypothetical protein
MRMFVSQLKSLILLRFKKIAGNLWIEKPVSNPVIKYSKKCRKVL